MLVTGKWGGAFRRGYDRLSTLKGLVAILCRDEAECLVRRAAVLYHDANGWKLTLDTTRYSIQRLSQHTWAGCSYKRQQAKELGEKVHRDESHNWVKMCIVKLSMKTFQTE